MNKFHLYGLSTLGLFFVYRLFRRAARKKRELFIATAPIPKSINNKIMEAYPHLTEAEVREVIAGLREYFHICNMAGKKFVSMPSQVVDVAWHEFILYTRQYQLFCSKAFGRFLHHVPAEAMHTPVIAQDGIKRAWRLSCKREEINHQQPHKLPMLFALDAKLKIANGFYYTLNCKTTGAADGYCASHIGCSSCGSFGCAGSSDGGGDSGGGCGGGD